MSIKCGKCKTSVYPVDPQLCLNETTYHKSCAKCEDCKCQITLANFTKSGETILCKVHYKKRFDEQGTYAGEDKFQHQSNRGQVGYTPSVAAPQSQSAANTPSETSAASSSVRERMKKFGAGANTVKCSQCNTSVYANDPQIQIDALIYHRSCAKCTECKCQINTDNWRKDGTTLYCRTHYEKKFREEGKLLGSDKFTGKTAQSEGGPAAARVTNSVRCAQCESAVYANDPQVQIDALVYHNSCAKCTECKCQINTDNWRKDGTTLYCRTHYEKKFREEGKLLGSDKFAQKSTPGRFGGFVPVLDEEGAPAAEAAGSEVVEVEDVKVEDTSEATKTADDSAAAAEPEATETADNEEGSV